jgi:hypothetical protein
VPDDVTDMITLFHVTGGYVYVNPLGAALGYEDVFTKLENARKHYEAIGVGADSLWPATFANPISRLAYSSPPVLHASGAASSNRVCRPRKTKFSVPVGPLRCLAMISSDLARSSSGKSVL